MHERKNVGILEVLCISSTFDVMYLYYIYNIFSEKNCHQSSLLLVNCIPTTTSVSRMLSEAPVSLTD